MRQFLYQRPREKLRDRGANALTTIELFQIIIGSGSKKVSAARIAKNVANLLNQLSVLAYKDLIEIPGLGFAKTTQILAAVELGARLNKTINSSTQLVKFHEISNASKRTLEYITVSGSDEHIHHRSQIVSDSNDDTVGVRKMFANALHDNANSMLVGIGFRSQLTNALDEQTLHTLKMIFDTANLLEIKVGSVWVVNSTSQQEFRRKAMQ